MNLLGLTGGIGTGKSTAAKYLSARGIHVIDTDHVAREVVAAGEPALAAVAKAFGASVIDGAGALNRKALAEIVFADPARRQQLEAILHPPIRARWTAQVEQWRKSAVEVAVVVIPLLFETGAQTNFDSVICTACTEATQQERLRPRGWSDLQIASRISAQWPMDKKIGASQYVIWTEGTLEIHHRQLARLLERIGR
jgi:dephospho-CoA kinase